MWRQAVRVAVTTILVVTALVPLAWFAVGALTGATLVTFRTGSMAPTMPQGAVAVTVPVAAGDIHVGDVVTVRRPDATLPVTHRVVEVDAISGQPAARELILQGDDNDTPDAAPYVVREAKRVVFSAPYIGAALMIAQTPLGMGVLTLLAGALTVWAFWPSRRGEGASRPVEEPAT